MRDFGWCIHCRIWMKKMVHFDHIDHTLPKNIEKKNVRIFVVFYTALERSHRNVAVFKNI